MNMNTHRLRHVQQHSKSIGIAMYCYALLNAENTASPAPQMTSKSARLARKTKKMAVTKHRSEITALHLGFENPSRDFAPRCISVRHLPDDLELEGS